MQILGIEASALAAEPPAHYSALKEHLFTYYWDHSLTGR